MELGAFSTLSWVCAWVSSQAWPIPESQMKCGKLNDDYEVVEISHEELNSDLIKAQKRVASTTVGEYWVSTVFLVFQHNGRFWFETMVFKEGWEEVSCERSEDYETALRVHEDTVLKLQENYPDKDC